MKLTCLIQNFSFREIFHFSRTREEDERKETNNRKCVSWWICLNVENDSQSETVKNILFTKILNKYKRVAK